MSPKEIKRAELVPVKGFLRDDATTAGVHARPELHVVPSEYLPNEDDYFATIEALGALGLTNSGRPIASYDELVERVNAHPSTASFLARQEQLGRTPVLSRGEPLNAEKSLPKWLSPLAVDSPGVEFSSRIKPVISRGWKRHFRKTTDFNTAGHWFFELTDVPDVPPDVPTEPGVVHVGKTRLEQLEALADEAVEIENLHGVDIRPMSFNAFLTRLGKRMLVYSETSNNLNQQTTTVFPQYMLGNGMELAHKGAKLIPAMDLSQFIEVPAVSRSLRQGVRRGIVIPDSPSTLH